MIVDSSVVVCLFADEPERHRFSAALIAADRLRMSAGTWLELGAVSSRKRQFTLAQLSAWCIQLAVVIEPVTVQHAATGQEAYRRFGKGSGHPAGLNFGDCFAYALAKTTGEPLLFKGDDFHHTDLALAAASSYPHD